MTDNFSAQVTFLILVLTAVGGVWWRIESAISKAKTEAETKATSATALATFVQAQLAEHKLHVAETYITKAGMRETRDEIMSGIANINQRLDRVFENRPSPARSRRSGE